MAHVAIQEADDTGRVTFGQHVTDDEYKAEHYADIRRPARSTGQERKNAALPERDGAAPDRSRHRRRRYLVVRRGFGLVGQRDSSSSDFGDDLLCWGVPHERFGVVVPV
jgi:hypothetical protein